MRRIDGETANIAGKLTRLVMITLAAVFTVAAPAAAISLSFAPTAQTVDIGDPVIMDVVISGLEAAGQIVSAFDLDVTWDPAILGITAVGFYDELGDTLNVDYGSTLSPGRVDLWELSYLTDAQIAALHQGDEVTIFTLYFDTLAVGTSLLIFDPNNNPGIDVKGLSAQVLDLEVTNGSVTVLSGGQTVPEPGTFLLLGAGLLGLVGTGLRRRRRG